MSRYCFVAAVSLIAHRRLSLKSLVKLAASVSLAFFAFSAPSAKAAVIPTFSPGVRTTADSNVLNVGTTALAYDVSGSSGPVNGVTFSNAATQDGITLTGFLANNASDSLGYLSPALQGVLAGNNYNNSNAPATLTLSGLTPGLAYEVQLFGGTDYAGYNGAGGGGFETVNGATLTFGGAVNNSFVTSAPFIADSSGMAMINLVEGAGSNAPPIFNALDLRQVPEPASLVALAGLCGMGLIGLVRRRLRAA